MTSEMTVVAMLAITVGAAIYVAWPLLVGRTPAWEYFGSEPDEPLLQRLMFQRDTTYAAMKELDFDFAMGNLSERDYQQLQERYKRKAVAILKRIDDVKAGKRVPEDVLDADEDEFGEEQPSRVPQRAAASRESRVNLDVEQEIEAFRRKSKASVAGNGTAPGTARSRAPSACPSCGRPIADPEAVFCSKCGATVRNRAGRGGSRQATPPRDRKPTQHKGDHHE